MSHSKATLRRRGFTAIELSAVATIIAILALILIPIMGKRVEEAKVTAAQADMRQIETSQTMIHADTAYYVRLFDMSRPQPQTGDDDTVIAAKLPKASWNEPRTSAMLNTFRNNWKGPYAAPHRQRSLYEIVRGYPDLFRGNTVLSIVPGEGPVLILTADNTDEQGDGALMRLQYPTDPWGNPYIFFGSGRMGTGGGFEVALDPKAETNFNTAAIYCMGPNGVPGDQITPTSWHYFRENGELGTYDDMMFQF